MPEFGTAMRSGCDFKSQELCRFREPRVVAERVAAIKTSLDCGTLFVGLRQNSHDPPSSTTGGRARRKADSFAPTFLDAIGPGCATSTLRIAGPYLPAGGDVWGQRCYSVRFALCRFQSRCDEGIQPRVSTRGSVAIIAF
jgi:hypothetical protein